MLAMLGSEDNARARRSCGVGAMVAAQFGGQGVDVVWNLAMHRHAMRIAVRHRVSRLDVELPARFFTVSSSIQSASVVVPASSSLTTLIITPDKSSLSPLDPERLLTITTVELDLLIFQVGDGVATLLHLLVAWHVPTGSVAVVVAESVILDIVPLRQLIFRLGNVQENRALVKYLPM